MITKNFGPLTIRYPGIARASALADMLYGSAKLSSTLRVGLSALICLSYAEEDSPVKGLVLDQKALDDISNYLKAVKHLCDMGATDDDIIYFGVMVADWFKEQASKPLSEAEKMASFFAPRKAV